MTELPPVAYRADIERRLLSIFPRAAFDTALSSPIAAAGVTAMLYVGAIVPEDDDPTDDHRWVSPTMCLWLSDAAMIHANIDDREQWYAAARRGRSSVDQLITSWGHTYDPWYANNSREPLRDESLRMLRERGAVVWRPGKPQNYSGPRWALSGEFAELFNPDLTGAALDDTIEHWRSGHLNPLEMVRISVESTMAAAATAVAVTLPHDGSVRTLEPGVASLILKGVIEQWAPVRLTVPVVVSISEPGNKLYLADAQLLSAAGISISVSTLLPDALIVDIGTRPATFWVVEAVATDGEIDDARKAALLQWATDQQIPPAQCKFLSAFVSRNTPPVRKRLKDLASGSFAWFLAEPSHELAWYELADSPHLT